ncbi:hypothetical protein AURDEDRAFT_158242 [Auricularia subglabra TFB-10046 SS5]|nr:hypothetical protein AURDEDRAFT_158242 [Auricularia subglabra TFB-10046 SS5]
MSVRRLTSPLQGILFPEVRSFNLSRHPKYAHVIATGKRDNTAILLDIGCFFGVDLQKAGVDGYPAQSVLGTDLRKEWFTLSRKLSSGPRSAVPAFLAGDIFDDTFLDPSSSDTVPTASKQQPLPAAELRTLTSLKRRARFVYSHSFFHLFQEDAQRNLARRLASLLDDEPGAMLFGSHAGLAIKGFREQGPTSNKMFCHSPESWQEMIAQVFAEQGRKVVQEVDLVQVYRPHHGTDTGFTSVLVWSATVEAKDQQGKM